MCIEDRAREVVDMMTRMIGYENKSNHVQKEKGILHSKDELRQYVYVAGMAQEVIIRPLHVFGPIRQIDLSSETKKVYDQVLQKACIYAKNTLVEAVIKMCEPTIQKLEDSKAMQSCVTKILFGAKL